MLKCPNPKCYNSSSFEVDNIPSELAKIKEDIQVLKNKLDTISK